MPYQIDAEHYFAHWWIEFDFGKTSSYVDVIRREDDPSWEFRVGNRPAMNQIRNRNQTPRTPHIAWWIDPNCAGPLVFDLPHNGFHLTSANDGVLFDIDGDGDLDRIAWTRADSDDAWLAALGFLCGEST